MRQIEISELRDNFVFHYGVDGNEISVQTLASSLSPLIDVVELVNDYFDPGSELDVKVVAIAPGSFRLVLSPKTKKLLGTVWEKGGKELVIGVVLIVLAAKMNGEPPQVLNVEGDVIYQTNNYEIKLPADCKPQVEKAIEDEDIDQKIVDAFENVNIDPNVKSFGITSNVREETPDFLIPRSDFERMIIRRTREEEETKRELTRRITVRVLKTVFERGNRKWEFVHNNLKISAPVLDQDFFDSLLKHEIVFGNGDYMDITLRTEQEWNELIQTWVDNRYFVDKVHRHISGPTQGPLL